MEERGIKVKVDHTTIMRWVHQYFPEIEKKIGRHLRAYPKSPAALNVIHAHAKYGSVAKIFFAYFEAIIGIFMCHFSG